MFYRWQLTVLLSFQLAAMPLLQVLALSTEERHEIDEANSLSDPKAIIQHLDKYLALHPNSARVVGFRAEVYNLLGKSTETIRDANRYFELNKERQLPVIYKVRAHAYFKEKEYTKSLHDLEAAAKLDDKDGDTALMQALALQNLGRNDEALTHYTKAISLNCKRAYSNKACLEFQLNQKKAGTDDCIAYIRAFNTLEAQSALAGTVASIGPECELALYDGLIAANLAKEFVYSKRAEVLFRQGQFVAADLEYQRCERKFGYNCGDSRINIYLRLHQYEKALVLVNKLISESPKRQMLYLWRGSIYLGLKNYELALADYDRSDSIVQTDSEFLRNRAECSFRMGRYSKAEKDFAKGNRQGSSVHSLTFEGLNFKALKKNQEGVRCFTLALKQNPLSPSLFSYRADCYSRLNDLVHCDSDLTSAIALDLKNPAYYLARGTCRLNAGQNEAAVKDLTAALTNKDLYSVVYATRAKAYANLGKHDLAEQDLRAAGTASKALDVVLFKQ